MKARTDRRSREVRSVPAAERAAEKACRAIVRLEVTAAKALATIERTRSYLCGGYPSVHAYAAAVGYGPQHAGRLLALGRALRLAPELRIKVRSGQVPPESAVAVGKVLAEPTLDLTPEERRAWIVRAETDSPRSLRRAVEKAIEEARLGAPTLPLRFRVTTEVRDGYRRARLLMSKGQPRMIAEGAAFGVLVTEWLAQNDPALGPLPERRGSKVRSRYIPRRVVAEVERRSGGMCEICGERRAVEKMHIRTPFAEGGPQDVSNIADGCRECHMMADAGVFEFIGFDEDGRPRWKCNPAALRVRERAPPFRATCSRRANGRSGVRDRSPRVREGCTAGCASWRAGFP